ncbi:MAG: putative regulatory protein, partial [Nocardioides sp.]|nr:putative regulatory protein [Nocardioides sp.]
DALLAVGGSTDAAAAHVVKGTDVGDAHSVAILIRASDEAASTAPDNAADLRLQAVDLIPHTDADRPQRVAETIGLLHRAGRSDEGWPLAETALQTGLPNEVQAQMHFEAAEALAVGGHSAAALAHTRTALELDGVEDSTRGLLLAAEASAQLAAGEPRAALRAGEKAVSLGRRLGKDACVDRALVTMGAAEGMRGRLSRSLRLLEQAAELVSSDSSESRHIEQQWTRGCTLIALDRFDEASAAFAGAQQWANRYSSQGTAVFGCLCRSQLQLYKGALDDALAEAESGLVRAGELESWTHVPELLAVLAEVCAYREQPELAKRHVVRGIGLVGPRTRFTTQPLAWASAVIDEAATNDCSDSSAVLAPLAAALERWPDHSLALAFNPVIAPRLVTLALKVKDEKLASAAAEAAESLSRGNPGVASLAAAGMQARGVLENDAECLVAAVREFQASPRPLARARACVDAARVLSQQHRSAQAAEHLQTALAEYESVGAASPARRVRERLSGQAARGKDRKAAHRPAFGWGSLTEAELRVARLVARALTNRVIADELELSPHTVESHLRHAFRKLDIGSRIELTRVVLRQEAALENDRRLDGHP